MLPMPIPCSTDRLATESARHSPARISSHSARHLGLLTSGSAIAVGLLLAVLIGRGIARPIGKLTGVMRDLAGGLAGVAIRYGTRRDEVGEMAHAVGVFRDHMTREAQLVGQRETERQQAEADKRAALVRMAETVESETQKAIEQIGHLTATMATTTNEMRVGGTGARQCRDCRKCRRATCRIDQGDRQSGQAVRDRGRPSRGGRSRDTQDDSNAQ
jgi:methyl-accepting chemotaxis protein